MMKIYIKNMVSFRCKLAVKAVLDEIGLKYGKVELGEVEVLDTITPDQRLLLKEALHKAELELMEDRKSILVEKIKNVIVDMVHYNEELSKIKYSDYIGRQLNLNYNYLANLFSEVTGSSIINYIIAHKIEKVKELLVYYELTLSEIAWKLNYSSVAHLSNQFKKVTGVTPSDFKKLEEKKLIPLEYVGMSKFVA